MKRSLLSALFLLVIGTRVWAADYAPVPEALPVQDWTGFYIGATAGSTIGGNLEAEPKDIPWIKFDQEHDGIAAGGFAGYRWQAAATPVVLGVEVTGLWSDIHGQDDFSDLLIFPFVLSTSANVDTLVLAEGQVGVALHERALLYAHGGWAGADVSFDANIKIPGLFSEKIFDDSRWASGAVAGVGFDLQVAPNIRVGAVWNHIVFNDLGLSDDLGGGGGGAVALDGC